MQQGTGFQNKLLISRLALRVTGLDIQALWNKLGLGENMFISGISLEKICI